MKRQLRIEGEVAFIPLTQGYEAVIDAADAPLVSGSNWRALVRPRTIYAQRHSLVIDGVRPATFLHRAIMRAPTGMEVDHIDGNGLNNRRSNLRLATHAENGRNARIRSDNTSGFKGVFQHKRDGSWRAQIHVDGRNKYLGVFRTPEDAHAAYVQAAANLHGPFARVSS